jgi:uncharacterized protein YwbE
MAVIIKKADGTWRMADVVKAIGNTKSPIYPKFIQVKYADNHVTNELNVVLVTHIVTTV